MQLVRRGRRTIEKKAFLSDSPKNEFKRRRHEQPRERGRGEGMENNCVDYGLLMKMLSDLFFLEWIIEREKPYLDGL